METLEQQLVSHFYTILLQHFGSLYHVFDILAKL